MTDVNGEFPTVIGGDARFKGELSFDKGVRINGQFDGQIKSKGTLHIAEGAKVTANIEAGNVKVEGECKGNLFVSEKLHLMATAKIEGDLRATRLEVADGAVFSGHVVTGQGAAEAHARRGAPTDAISGQPTGALDARSGPGLSGPRPRSPEVRVSAAS